MIVYAESSAVLSWLLGEPDGVEVGEILKEADFVVASQLTFTECERAKEPKSPSRKNPSGHWMLCTWLPCWRFSRWYPT